VRHVWRWVRGVEPAVLVSLVMLLAAAVVPGTPPTIGSLQPNGGEVIAGGSYYPVLWTAAHDDDPYVFTALRYRVDPGPGFPLFLTADLFPNGTATWPWHVPEWETATARAQACVHAWDGNVSCVESAGDYAITATPPYAALLSPSDGARNVPVAPGLNILIGFSPPADPASMMISITPSVAVTITWGPGYSYVVLSLTGPLAGCTTFVIGLTHMGRDYTWSFQTECIPPLTMTVYPPAQVTSPIVVEFSNPMASRSVSWTIAPDAALTAGWTSGNRILSLSPPTAFETCTAYTFGIASATDLYGQPLEPGPFPNPVTFTTECPNPRIVSTDPVDGTAGVYLTTPIRVAFSEPMDSATVTWSIDPVLAVGDVGWDAGNTVLILWHNATPFTWSTLYTVRVDGSDVDGYPLVPGPVQNPWSFRSVVVDGGVPALKLIRFPLVVQLSWAPVRWAFAFRVYESQDRFAPFPSGWNLLSMTSDSWLAVPHLSDGLTHYYIVRATDGTQESWNSTMGVKVEFSFSHVPGSTNIVWFSLPYDSEYRRASDIAVELGAAKVDVIGRWDPATQTSMVYYYARGAWRGTDFDLRPGDGLYVGVTSSFRWTVVGTDPPAALSFTSNPAPGANVNWVGLPYAGAYRTAGSLSDELTSSRVVEVGRWDATTQTALRWYWTGSEWTGSDFEIRPGDGVYLVAASSFVWTPRLVTSFVP